LFQYFKRLGRIKKIFNKQKNQERRSKKEEEEEGEEQEDILSFASIKKEFVFSYLVSLCD